MQNTFLSPVDLKLVRATEQISELETKIASWVAANPIPLRGELSEDRKRFRVIVEDFAVGGELDTFGVLVGECAHNLRSALDNSVYALARLKADPPQKGRSLAFPIFTNEGRYMQSPIRAALSEISDDAAALIERIQPYHRSKPDIQGSPEIDPLVVLQELSNSDKHRIPAVGLILPKQVEFNHSVEFNSSEDASASLPPNVTVWGDIIRPGITLLEHITTKPMRKVSSETTYVAVVAVRVGDKFDPIRDLLRNLLWYVQLVVDQFRPFFMGTSG